MTSNQHPTKIAWAIRVAAWNALEAGWTLDGIIVQVVEAVAIHNLNLEEKDLAGELEA